MCATIPTLSFDGPRLAVDLIAGPYDRPRTADLALELPQEQHDLLTVEVLIVAQQREAQPHPHCPWPSAISLITLI